MPRRRGLISWCASTGCRPGSSTPISTPSCRQARRHHAAEGGRRRLGRARRRQARGARGDQRPARRPHQDPRASPPKPRRRCSSPAPLPAPSARLIGLTWGAEDLSAELGAEANRDAQGRFLDPYRLARVLCLAGAAAANVPALDTVYVDFRNSEGFRRECEEARRDGFVGKMAIHPAQVPIINEVFTPQRGRARAGASDRRRLCAKPRRRRRRHRRRDVRPPASGARGALAGAGGADKKLDNQSLARYAVFGSNTRSSRNSSVTAPALPSGTAR